MVRAPAPDVLGNFFLFRPPPPSLLVFIPPRSHIQLPLSAFTPLCFNLSCNFLLLPQPLGFLHSPYSTLPLFILFHIKNKQCDS